MNKIYLQEKLVGEPGQVVGFDADGKAVAEDSKGAALKAETAEALDLSPDDNPTVDDAFIALAMKLAETTTTSNGAAKVVTGSYVGTGKTGSSNKNSLTFPSPPKFVIVSNCKVSQQNGEVIGPTIDSRMFVWFPGITYINNTGSNNNGYVITSLSGNKLSWYHTNSYDTIQLNVSGKTYRWFAIL